MAPSQRLERGREVLPELQDKLGCSLGGLGVLCGGPGGIRRPSYTSRRDCEAL